MAGYIQFLVSSESLSTTISVQSRHEFRFPDKTCMYALTFYNGINIILTSWPKKHLDSRTCKQDFAVFDKKFTLTYGDNLALKFTIFRMTADECVFFVEKKIRSVCSHFGSLRLYKDGTVTWDKEPVETTESRRRYTKALVINGG